MTTNIELLDKWLLYENGPFSLRIQSFKDDINSRVLSSTAKYLGFELEKIEETNKVIEFLNNEEFYHLSLVFESPGFTILKSDTVRSVPLFYTFNNNHIYISDRNHPKDGYELDEGSIIEMAEVGYVSESRTVYKNIFGIQAAEVMVFNNEGIKKDRFFKYDVGQAGGHTNKLSINEYANKLDSIFKEIFKEVIESIPDEGRIIVPLSGGHDSRIIVNYLFKLGYNNVLCYSYGIPDNVQSKISKQVAEELGYDWHFIEYTEEKWGELHETGDFDNYIKYAFNGVSTPHLQDFLAVYELKKDGVLKSEDVFVPGHGLDILAETVNCSMFGNDMISAAVQYFSWSEKMSLDIDETLYKRYAKIYEDSGINKIGFIDYLFWQERVAKFTVNSLEVYKFFGYTTRIPFWDIRLIHFWMDIKLELKKTREFLFAMESECLLIQQLRGIPYARDRNHNGQKKNNLKGYIPNFLKVLYLRISKRKQPQSEGLNLIYSKKATSVSELLGSTNKWPEGIINGLGSDLRRYPYQINHHFLTRLYTINKLLKNQS